MNIFNIKDDNWSKHTFKRIKFLADSFTFFLVHFLDHLAGMVSKTAISLFRFCVSWLLCLQQLRQVLHHNFTRHLAITIALQPSSNMYIYCIGKHSSALIWMRFVFKKILICVEATGWREFHDSIWSGAAPLCFGQRGLKDNTIACKYYRDINPPEFLLLK